MSKDFQNIIRPIFSWEILCNLGIIGKYLGNILQFHQNKFRNTSGGETYFCGRTGKVIFLSYNVKKNRIKGASLDVVVALLLQEFVQSDVHYELDLEGLLWCLFSEISEFRNMWLQTHRYFIYKKKKPVCKEVVYS